VCHGERSVAISRVYPVDRHALRARDDKQAFRGTLMSLKQLSDSELINLTEKARTLTRQRFGRTIQLYAPLYLSNECVDTCLYCGFSRENKILRKTLTPEEVFEEAKILTKKGFQHILFVAGEHPIHVSPDYLEKVIQKIKPLVSSLSIEVAPLEESSYRQLIAQGLDGVVIYQETYDPEIYQGVHKAGPKKYFEKRKKSPEEAARAGIRQLGMGILLGLSDWRQEAQNLIEHVREMKKKYWQTEITISLPRLRPCASNYQPLHPISDRDFVQLIAALRVALPDVGIVLSTRESPALRDQLIGLGVTRMSAGSSTEPGGYGHPEENLKQFEIEDTRSATTVATVIQQKGFEPIWKDWERTST